MDANKRDYIWAFIGYISEAGVYAVLTPIMAIYLPSEELGLWYTFMSIYMMTTILDNGFSPIITRNAAYCMGGAKELVKEGIPKMSGNCGPNWKLLEKLFHVNRIMVAVISCITFILLITIGSPYIMFIARHTFKKEYLIAWSIFSLAISINLFVISLPAFLRGVGAIAEAQKIIAIGRTMQLVICMINVLLGFGILGLAVGFLISISFIGILSFRYYLRNILPQIKQNSDDKNISKREILQAISFNSKKLILNSCGGYMITQANTLLCSAFINLQVTAKYSLTVQIFQALAMVSSIVLQINIPGISMANVRCDNKKRNKLFSEAISTYWCLDILFSLIVICFANNVLKMIGSRTLMLTFPLVLIVALENFVERNCSNFNQIIISANQVPFIKSTLISGSMIVFLSFISLYFTNLNLVGIIVIQGVVQAAYNYWYWPKKVCHMLEMNFIDMFILGLKSIKERVVRC